MGRLDKFEQEEKMSFSWIWDELTELGTDGCWLWHGKFTEHQYPITDKYPNGSPFHSIHRLVWVASGKAALKYRKQLFDGTIKHRCAGAPWCVNPNHFFITRKQERQYGNCKIDG